MAQELAGKVAIVTGASSGIGRATLLRFVEEGAAVLAVGRDERVLAEIAVHVGQTGGICEAFVADVTDPPAAEQIVAAAVKHLGGVDVLVNAAGIIASGTVENTSDEAWERMLAINVTAPFRLMRAAAPHLTERRGTIVNVSSVTGLRSFPGVLAYCVSKAGIDQLTRCAALELAPKQVRVNAVNPGVVVTNLHRRSGMAEAQYAAFLERSRETHPLGRPGTPEEIADTILFLAGPRSGWMTGETIALDGGRHLTCAR
jgi:NAD(P)-dependent dehydrogenase (short-subunit alcohol dehydrogenase family)